MTGFQKYSTGLKQFLIIFWLLNLGLQMQAQKTLVFLGSFNRDKDKKGLYVYELNSQNGKLTQKSALSGILNPSFLTLSPDGNYLYACTESKTKNAGSVSSFKINSEKGELHFINSQKSGGENPVFAAVHLNGKWLINGNYTESSISLFPISENGKIELPVQKFAFEEGSVHADRQKTSHIHATVFSPDFKFLFSPDLGSDKIRVFQFNADNDLPLQMLENLNISSAAGSGPRHFTFHPNGKIAYCIEELTGSVSVYHFSAGQLKFIQRIATHTNLVISNFESSDIHISPDGKFLYASNRGSENNIAIFDILEDGRLKSVGYQKTYGKHPRTFALSVDGKFLIATNSVSGTVTVFRRNTETGLLRKTGRKIKIAGVSTVVLKFYGK